MSKDRNIDESELEEVTGGREGLTDFTEAEQGPGHPELVDVGPPGDGEEHDLGNDMLTPGFDNQ
jgi:hypothetical protein